MIGEYIDGFIEKKPSGSFSGKITINGVCLPSIIASSFDKDGNSYVWLRRKDVMDYDFETGRYTKRKAEPQFECYLKKQMDGNVVAYKGEFVFMKFMYNICGTWDRVLGTEKNRLNLFVEKKPMSEQKILLAINKQKRDGANRR